MQIRNALLSVTGLILLIVATRFPGLSSNLHVHDASWAIFFVAGFYLSDRWRWAFPTLVAATVAVDYSAINYYNMSNYCVTVAYGFLVPSYAALWLGGSWLRRHATADLRGLLALVMAAMLSVSICYLISNASFYWLGGRVLQPTWAGWIKNFTDWYGPMVRSPLIYVALVGTVHAIFGRQLRLSARPAHQAPG